MHNCSSILQGEGDCSPPLCGKSYSACTSNSCSLWEGRVDWHSQVFSLSTKPHGFFLMQQAEAFSPWLSGDFSQEQDFFCGNVTGGHQLCQENRENWKRLFLCWLRESANATFLSFSSRGHWWRLDIYKRFLCSQDFFFLFSRWSCPEILFASDMVILYLFCFAYIQSKTFRRAGTKHIKQYTFKSITKTEHILHF